MSCIYWRTTNNFAVHYTKGNHNTKQMQDPESRLQYLGNLKIEAVHEFLGGEVPEPFGGVEDAHARLQQEADRFMNTLWGERHSAAQRCL